jgi:hypothetical protein
VFLASTGDDKALFNAFIQRHPGQAKLISQSQSRSYKDVLATIETASFTIGGRYHTAIKSAAMGVPVILLASNSHKSLGLSNVLFGENRVRNLTQPAAIMSDVEAILTDWKGRSLAMTDAVQSLTPAFASMKSAIHGLISGALPPKPTRVERTRTARNAIANPKQAYLGQKRSRLSITFNRACYDCEWEPFPPQP